MIPVFVSAPVKNEAIFAASGPGATESGNGKELTWAQSVRMDLDAMGIPQCEQGQTARRIMCELTAGGNELGTMTVLPQLQP